MAGFFAYAFSLFSLSLILDALLLGGSWFLTFPTLTAPVAAFCGFLTALVWYFDIKNRERAKKKRRKAMVAMVVSLSCCIAGLLFLLVRMFV